MNAGNMIHVITLEQAAISINAAGSPVSVWTTVVTLRAELIERGVGETVDEAGARDRETVKLQTWFAASITTAMRLGFDGKHWNIRAVRPIGNDWGLEIEADRLGGVE